jgi:hypothetical protein
MTGQLGELAEAQGALQASVKRRALGVVAVCFARTAKQAPAFQPAQRAHLDRVGDTVEVAPIGKGQLKELRRAG